MQYVYIIITQRNGFIITIIIITQRNRFIINIITRRNMFIGLLHGAIGLYHYYTAKYCFSSSSSASIRYSVGLYAGCMLLVHTSQSDAGTVGKYALCKPGAVYIYASFYVEAMLYEYFHSFICMYVHNMYINHAL